MCFDYCSQKHSETLTLREQPLEMLQLILPHHKKPESPKELQKEVQAWLLKNQRLFL
jgi:hypothetical protein